MLIRDNWLKQYLDFIPLETVETFYDIGARQGESAKKFLDRNCRVISFEPNFEDFALIKCNENLRKFNVALSSQNGKLLLETESGTGRWHVSELESPTCLFVDCYTLSTVFHFEELASPDYIKIDTEGHELDILIGALNIISIYRPHLAIACYHNLHQCFLVHQFIHNHFPFYRFELGNYSGGKNHETILYCINPDKKSSLCKLFCDSADDHGWG